MRKFLFIFFLIFPCFIHAQVTKEKAETVILEKERKLVLLPLTNDTGEESYEYLGPGIIRMLRGELEQITYIPAKPSSLIIAAPMSNEKGRDSVDSVYDQIPKSDRLKLILELPVLTKKKEAWMKLTPVERAKRFTASYVVSGVIKKTASADILNFEMELFDARKKISYKKTVTAHVRDIYHNLKDTGKYFREVLTGKDLVTVKVTSNVDGALVYFDDMYGGRTPAEVKVIPGRYTLRIEQDGRSTTVMEVLIDQGRVHSYTLTNEALERSAGIDVMGEPCEADVYLNLMHIGKTPLKRNDLPPGTHRLRLSCEGYIDRIVGISLENKKETKVRLTLQKGDTLTYYKDPNYVVLDWTWHDVSFYTALTSLFFYAGYWKYRVQGNQTMDSIRRSFPQTAIWDIYKNAVDPEPMTRLATLYQLEKMSSNRRDADIYYRYSGGSAVLGITSLFLAGYFVYLGLRADEREGGEILSSPIRYYVYSNPMEGTGLGLTYQY